MFLGIFWNVSPALHVYTPYLFEKMQFPFLCQLYQTKTRNAVKNETSDSNISATETLSPIAGGGGGREDGLQDNGKSWCVCGGEKEGAEVMEGQ